MPIPKRPSQAAMQKIVDKFNAEFPLGGYCVLQKDGDQKVLTAVSHPAYILSGHTPVAFFEGVSGCYRIEDRVTKVKAITIDFEDPRLLTDVYKESGFDSDRDVHIHLDRINKKTTYWQEDQTKKRRARA